jgi:uroporphyrinogen III methyltransferase/synthase
LARADRGRELLRAELAAVAQVDEIAVYSQVDAVEADAPALRALSRGEIGYVILTSANIARALLTGIDETSRQRLRDGSVKLVTISPVTSAAVREFGFEPAAEAEKYTTEGVMEALMKLAS